MSSDIDVLEPTSCVSYRLRRATRLAAKSFDAALKPVGLRNTQFTLLSALDIEGPKSIGALSDLLATDATTLNRNLEVLERRGLVEDGEVGDDERVRGVQITSLGKTTLRDAAPLWQEAQRTVLDALGDNQWKSMMTKLKRIEEVCDPEA